MHSFSILAIIGTQMVMASSLLLSKASRNCHTMRQPVRTLHLTCVGRRELSRLNASMEENDIDEAMQKSAAWQSSKPPMLEAILQKTASRAIRTLSTTASGNWDEADGTKTNENINDTVLNVMDAVITRASSTLSDEPASIDTESESSKQHQDKRTYLNNPCVTPTALAHSLWKSTIIPYQDTVIDATCGNGKDCLAIAQMLFPKEQEDTASSDMHPQLIGIDIQSRAVANTKRSLLSALPDEIYYNHVTLLERSHEHLMDVIAPIKDGRSHKVGLVCYNLGYLPGGASDNYKECKTQTETTLNSITDAALLLRVGGLLSVMTYPGSNLEESIAVEHFVEGLAMLSTRDEGGWKSYVNGIPDYINEEKIGENNDGGRIRNLVSSSIERVFSCGSPKQTWRVFVHKPLGRPMSPILITAHRIK